MKNQFFFLQASVVHFNEAVQTWYSVISPKHFVNKSYWIADKTEKFAHTHSPFYIAFNSFVQRDWCGPYEKQFLTVSL